MGREFSMNVIWRGLGSALILLVSTGPGLAADDQVYTWRDASGRVHYGTQPPAEQPAEPVQLHAKPVPTPAGGRIYAWTDAEGRTHYSAQPPDAAAARQLKEEEAPLSTIRATGVRPGERQLLREQR